MQPPLATIDTKARRTAASYPTYAEAQQAVDYLADQNFPVEHIAIVAEGIRLVEQVTGRLGYGRAALNGAGAGALTGALIGFIFGVFNWVSPLLSALTLAVNGLVIGGIIGALFGLFSYGMTGGRRDFSSIRGMQAERYNVMADDEGFSEAYRLLNDRK